MSVHKFDNLQPAGPGFRKLLPWEAFTWNDADIDTGPDGIYGVFFYASYHPISILKRHREKLAKLLELDDLARDEASISEGFLLYRADETDWADELDQFTDTSALSVAPKALSFCLWETPRHAREASHLPMHNEAVRFALDEGLDVYESYSVKRYLLNSVDRETVETQDRDTTLKQRVGRRALLFSKPQASRLFVPVGIAA